MCVGMQVKLCYPLTMRAIPERLLVKAPYKSTTFIFYLSFFHQEIQDQQHLGLSGADFWTKIRNYGVLIGVSATLFN